MAEKMLIDASHEEETRVVVVRGNRIEEFDFESQYKKQLRGNIYLAKVTRVEPSLQAAFVDYGGNRHGFLAFSEIHPDYYQIPLADRQALLQAEAEAERAEAESEAADHHADADTGEGSAEQAKPAKTKARRGRGRKKSAEAADSEKVENAEATEAGASEPAPTEAAQAAEVDQEAASQPSVDEAESSADETESGDDGDKDESHPHEMLAVVETDSVSEEVATEPAADDEAAAEEPAPRARRKRRGDDENGDDDEGNGTKVESVGAEDALEEVPDRTLRKPRKQYRIQEVIKRRQILLVQVVKEERGNKGAALTTYLSLAGRYSVLMPNTARGGGISRKITNVPDRKRLKEIARELEVPQGMGVILRTAGANRTKVEIKRDFEYLMRLWENVRSLTLNSTAPTLVYEEGSLIKRSIRDLYNKDIGEIVVSGEEGYREAKTFMKMLMPSHAKVVQPYRDIHPIFARSGIEAQLDRMLQPQVTLKSGGYIIINQTEALVAIDVNSGRSTKEHSIEDTALQTNLEAAEEVARQLRLRDLAGLVVIDFIDMEEKRNNRSVEKKLKDCLKHDRARIQVGRISHFGLLEMSRQRIRASVLESTTQICEVCGGTGHVRSKSSVALHVIRGIEEYLLKNTTHNIVVRALPETALYLLNQKRDTIVDLEKRFGLSIVIEADSHIGTQHFTVERGEAVEEPVRIDQIVHYESPYEEAEEAEVEEDLSSEDTNEIRHRDHEGQDEGAGGHKRKRRRRRRGGGRSADGGEEARGSEENAETEALKAAPDGAEDEEEGEGGAHKRRRRGKRGGRRKRAEAAATDEAESGVTEHSAAEADGQQEEPEPELVTAAATAEAGDDEQSAAEEKADAGASAEAGDNAQAEGSASREAESAEPAAESEENAAPARQRRSPSNGRLASEPVVTSTGTGEDEDAEKAKPKKVGWWQRRGFF
ncbi:MAG TPA: Rne/Rng family ribonuclease [Pararhizobium sp.]|nr:Rne/Rng family ribonuclease [Pararhizobium sp.]